jgi:hypothetical protein
MSYLKNIFLFLISCATLTITSAQDTIRYKGNTLVNADYHHGQLQPVIGVHSMQVLRANREHPEMAEGSGYTYNHAPMLAYWNNRFYLEYLSDSIGESVPPGQTLLVTSLDGYRWSKPVVVFPKYKIPDGTTKEGHPGVANDLYSVMHQRMGVSKSKRLLVLGFYGICLDPKDDPNDGKGIGRVVREVLKDGSYGPVYFIHYNHLWNEKNTSYPFYTTSKDKGFVQACNELMATPLMMMQWAEEADRNDPLIPLKRDYKAFNYYHLPDGRVVGLWKNALTAISKDNGKTWPANAVRAPKFVNSNAKFWGQRTSDGRYAIVYNPSEYRWPLAVSVSDNGLDYNNLLLVNGEISTMRYGGNYKSYGPQYVRGIIETDGVPPDGNLWVTYSMNKEDIWISCVPVPLTEKTDKDVEEDFAVMPDGGELKYWNVFSPMWAPVVIEKGADGAKRLVLKDWDRYDYARAERVVPAAKRMTAEFTVTPAQNNTGQLDIELQDAKGTAGIRLTFDSTGELMAKAGARYKNFMKYQAGETYRIRIQLDTDTRFYVVNINGKDVVRALLFVPLESVSRVVFRTGGIRRYPDIDTQSDQNFDLPQAGDPVTKAEYSIGSFKTKKM